MIIQDVECKSDFVYCDELSTYVYFAMLFYDVMFNFGADYQFG